MQSRIGKAEPKPAFVRRAFEAPSLTEQGYELQAVTEDGNEFIVTIILLANSKNALKLGTRISRYSQQVLSAHALSRMMCAA